MSDALGDGYRWLVVKNGADGDAFRLYKNSKTRRYLFDALHAREITMPRLYDWLVTALNEHNVTIMRALNNPALNLLDGQRLKHWQSRFYQSRNESGEDCLRLMGCLFFTGCHLRTLAGRTSDTQLLLTSCRAEFREDRGGAFVARVWALSYRARAGDRQGERRVRGALRCRV